MNLYKKFSNVITVIYENDVFCRIINTTENIKNISIKIINKAPIISSLFAGLLSIPAFSSKEYSLFLILSFQQFFFILNSLFVKKRKKTALLAGLLFGFGIYGYVYSWLLSLQEAGFSYTYFLAILSYFATVFYHSIFIMLSSYLSVKLAYNKLSLFLYFSCLVTFSETIERYFIDLTPFTIIGYGMTEMKYFIQMASVVGSFGITFLFLLILSLMNIPNYRKKGLLIFTACCTYGFYRIHIKWNYKTAKEKFDLTIVQPNFNDEKRMNYYEPACDSFAEISEIKKFNKNTKHNKNKKHLIVGPETIITYSPEQIDYFVKKGCDINENDIGLRKGDSNIILGTGFWDRRGKKTYNSYQFFTYDYSKKKAKVLAKYDKKYVIPFGETCPRWFYVISKIFPKSCKKIHTYVNELKTNWEITPSDGKNTIKIPGISPFAMNICSDIIQSGLSMYDTFEPTWILTTTNFHTFNNDKKTTELSHQGILWGIFRSIELGRQATLAMNFGISAIINLFGEILIKLDPKKEGVIHFEMSPKYDITLFCYWRKKLILIIIFGLFTLLSLNKYNISKRKSILENS